MLLDLQCLDTTLVRLWGGGVTSPECAVADGKALVPAEVAMAARRYGCNQKFLVLFGPSSCRRPKVRGTGVIPGCPLGMCDKVKKETFLGGRKGYSAVAHAQAGAFGVEQLPKGSSH